jgi:HYR domain
LPEFLLVKGIFALLLIVYSLIGLGQSCYSQSNGTQNLIDTIPPLISVPKDSTLEASSNIGRNLTYKVSAADQVDGTINAACDRISGSMFPIGSTSVICEATDKSGNKASASFQVTIKDSTPPDTKIVASRTGWIGNINASSATISNQANFEIVGSDLVGVRVTMSAGLILENGIK